MLSALFNAPVTFGVDLFIWIVCFLAAFGAGAIVINMVSEFSSKKGSQKQED